MSGDRCKDEEPKVIDNELIDQLLKEQAPPGEAGRLVREEGVPLDEIAQIRFEYLKILRIDHLWMLTSLTKLSLCNNLIEKIENLGALVNLKELNLSFNKITKIENLDALVNLEILTLYNNLISTLGNMDTLKKLTIFSIGNNLIEEKFEVIYLRQFNELKSLNMAGNPCAEEPDFLNFIGVFLPHLVYYQYKIIPIDTREDITGAYTEKLREVLAEEAKKKKIQDKIDAEIAEAEFYSGSFVEFLGSSHLFDSMFETDTDGQTLMYLGDDVTKYYNEYKEQFVVICKRIFEVGQKQYKIREVEVDQFFESINTNKQKAQRLSIEKMEEFLEAKVEIFFQMKKFEEVLKEGRPENEAEIFEKMQNLAEEYNDLLHKTWKQLMSLELTLYEQMEEVIQNFEQTLTEMINVFVEAAQGYFTELRTLEASYLEYVSTEANNMLTLSNLQADYPVPEELQHMMSDREILSNALGASHDIHMQMIDTREDRLVSRARGWLEGLVTGLQKNEIGRNRGKVLEINHFLDIQREEFDEIHAANMEMTMLDPEVSAVLT